MQLSRNYVLAAVALWAVSLPLHAEEKPKAVLEQAIQAHGGNKNLARTLTGRLTAELKGTVSSDVEFTFQDEETFQLPRRYKRVLQGQFNGKPFRMTYAIEEGVGWIQQNDEDPREYRGQKLPLEKYWNAILAQLPELLRDDSILSAGGEADFHGRPALAIKVAGQFNSILYFDKETGLLAGSKKQMAGLLSPQVTEVELVYGNYQDVEGVKFPKRFTASSGGKRVFDITIKKIEFLDKIDDREFAKPELNRLPE